MKTYLLKISFLSLMILTSCNNVESTSINTTSSNSSSITSLPEGKLEVESIYDNLTIFHYFPEYISGDNVKCFKISSKSYSNSYIVQFFIDTSNHEKGIPLPNIEVFNEVPFRYSDKGKVAEYQGGYLDSEVNRIGTSFALYLRANENLYLRYSVPQMVDYKAPQYGLVYFEFGNLNRNEYHDHGYVDYEWIDEDTHKIKCSCGDYIITSHETTVDEEVNRCVYCKGPYRK